MQHLKTKSRIYLQNNTTYKTFELPMRNGKKAYFASDLHLGLYPYELSAKRERMIVAWLDQIKEDAAILFLVGDIFDYWYEYKKVVSRGYVRFLAKIAEFTDNGIPVHFFTGNHDVWMFDYLPSELGVFVHKNPIIVTISGKKFFIGHGDGIGPGDTSYKLLRKIFHNKFLQFLFSRLHPNFTYMLGQNWSKHSRYSKGLIEPFLGVDKEYNILFARDFISHVPIDYFVFGHRHIPMDITLSQKSRLINLGEWISSCTFAEFDGNAIQLKSWIPEYNDRILYMNVT